MIAHRHFRPYNPFTSTVSSHGGTTIAIDVQFNTISFGVAFCNPSDQFDRKLAKTIAYERLFKNPIMFPVSDITSAFTAGRILTPAGAFLIQGEHLCHELIYEYIRRCKLPDLAARRKYSADVPVRPTKTKKPVS